jgi:hypothetical protein
VGTRHTVSDKDPAYVTRADQYRLSGVSYLTPEHPHFTAMQEFFPPESRCPDGYGLGFMESEEHSVTYVGTVEQIQEFLAGGGRGLDVSQGRCYPFWPYGRGWDELVPFTTWTPGGQGVATEFDHRDTTVIVYEYLEDRDGELVPMVAFHCLYCHNDHRITFEHTSVNRGPKDRRWMAYQARVHIRRAEHECRRMDPGVIDAVVKVVLKELGPGAAVPSWESLCATTGPCAEIRHVHVAAAATKGQGES